MKERKISDNISYSLKSIWNHDKVLFLLYFFNAFLVKLQPFIFIFFIKVLFDGLSKPDAEFWSLIVIILVFILLIMAANFLQRYSYGMTSVRFITYRLLKKKELASKTIEIEYENLEDPDFLDRYNRAVHACLTWNTGMEGLLREACGLIMSVLSAIGFIGILLTLNWLVTLALVIIGVLYHFIKMKMAGIDIAHREKLSLNSRKAGYFSDIMSGSEYGKEIRLYKLKDFMTGQFMKVRDMLLYINRDIARKKRIWYLLSYLLEIIKTAGYFIYLIISVFSGAVGIGSFVMYINTFNDFSAWFEEIIDSLTDIKRMTKETDDFRSIMELPSIDDQDKEAVGEIHEIEFRDVWFKYKGTEDYALKGVSFKLNSREKVALVGANGSGKTTIVKLICCFYMPDRGEILINGIPVNRINRKSLYRQLAVVFQEVNIFAFSIASNVALSRREDIDFDRAAESLSRTGVGELIEKAPEGINTVIKKILDENGIELSGGENQGIAIARTIYKDSASVNILDEPTSHFDALMEQRIYSQYNMISGSRISLFISHRLASTQFCDRIILLQSGRILEEGTHETLLAYGGKYREMFEVQAKYYKEDGDTIYENRE